MSAVSSQRLAKPQLRNLLMSKSKRAIMVGIGLGVVACISYRIFVGQRHKQQYADFYKTYDAEKEFNRMRNAGVFQSCDPDP